MNAKILVLASLASISLFRGLEVRASSKNLDSNIARESNYNRLLSEANRLKRKRANKQALSRFQKLVKLRPADSQAHAGLGWVLFDTGQTQSGIKEELIALKLNPRNADAHHHLATIYLSLNKLPEAAHHFRCAINIDPSKECSCGPVRALLRDYPEGSHSHK